MAITPHGICVTMVNSVPLVGCYSYRQNNLKIDTVGNLRLILFKIEKKMKKTAEFGSCQKEAERLQFKDQHGAWWEWLSKRE